MQFLSLLILGFEFRIRLLAADGFTWSFTLTGTSHQCWDKRRWLCGSRDVDIQTIVSYLMEKKTTILCKCHWEAGH